MSDQPLLTPEAVREWVGDFEIGKGRPYADTAVYGCRWEESAGILIAYVRGTRVQPYQVCVSVGDRSNGTAKGTIHGAHCTCPVGENGKCKHVAAVLLAYLEDPARFPETMRADISIGSRSRDELLTLLECLIDSYPELKPWLAVPMPGFVTGDVSPDLFRGRAVEVIQSARMHDERAEEDVIAGLRSLLWLWRRYRSEQNTQAAEAVTEGLTLALRNSGLNRDRLRQVLNHAGEWEEVRRRLGFDEPAGGQPPPF